MENATMSAPAPAGLDDYHLRVPSAPEWIESTVDYLVRRATRSGAVAPARATRLMLALHEALTNAVVHGNLGVPSSLKEEGDDTFARAVAERCADPAYAGRVVDVRAAFDGATARWELTDEGEGFDHEAVMRRLEVRGPDLERPSGRGLVMIRAFMDELRFEEGGRRVVMAMHQPGVERREQRRVPLARGVRVAPIGPDGAVDFAASQEAVTRDISGVGVGLLHPPLGGATRLMITIPTESGAVSVPAEVRRWEAVGENVVEVGCRFEAPAQMGDGAVDRLLGRVSEGLVAAGERRESPRVPYTARVSVWLPGVGEVSGFARDLSRLGIAFFTTVEVPQGVVELTLPQGDEAEPVRVRAHVLRCTRLADGFYDVAARFVGE